MAPETRYTVYCPGEVAEMRRKHSNAGFDNLISPRPGRNVVAHVCVSLYDDDECTVSTSETVKNCDRGVVTEQMKQQIINEHRASERELMEVDEKGVTSTRSSRAYQLDKLQSTSWSAEHAKAVHQRNISTERRNDEARKAIGVTVVKHSLRQHLDSASQDAQESEDECKEVCIQTKTHSIMIQNEDEVVKHMTTILKNMQQTAVKRLAKAWIKGICPKKQAKFPYHNCKVLPKWWPDTSVCPFTEPDHIRKEQRLQLCLHLLRLRPDPNDLQAWNDNDNAPHKSHILKGWTEFLREVARPEVLMDVRQTDADNTSKRYNHLANLYDIARLEESYMNGEVDGTTTFQWAEPVSPRKKNKTTVKLTKATKRPLEKGESADESEREGSGRKRNRKRRNTKASTTSNSREANHAEKSSTSPSATSAHATIVTNHSAPTESRAVSNDTPASSTLDVQPFQYISACGAGDNPYASRVMNMDAYRPLLSASLEGCLPDESYNSSFSSNFSSMYHPSATNSFGTGPGHRDMPSAANIHHALACLAFKHEPEQQLCMNASEIPQPYFATVPNSPLLPPAGDVPSSLHTSFSSMPMGSTTYAQWPLATQFHPAFAAASSSYDSIPQHMLSKSASNEGPSSVRFDGIRTLANSPIEMSSAEQLGPRTLSNHSSFRSSHY